MRNNDERQMSVTVMSNPRDWRLVWLNTWDEGWDLRVLCFSFRCEPPVNTSNGDAGNA